MQRRILTHPDFPDDTSSVGAILRSYGGLWDCVKLQNMEERGHNDTYVIAAVHALALLSWWRLYGMPRMDAIYERTFGTGWTQAWCAPVGVYVRPRLRFVCGHRLCPWCYSRKWSDAYMFLPHQLRDHGMLWYTEITAHLAALNEAMMDAARNWCWRIRRALALGDAVTGINVEPVADNDEFVGWQLRSGSITIDKPKHRIKVPGSSGIANGHVKRTRIKPSYRNAKLRKCLERLCTYPMHVFGGPTGSIARARLYGQVMMHRHLLDYTGMWRSTSTEVKKHYHKSRTRGMKGAGDAPDGKYGWIH